MLGRRLLNLEMLENREVPASVQSFDIVPDLPSSSPKHLGVTGSARKEIR